MLGSLQNGGLDDLCLIVATVACFAVAIVARVF